MSETPAAVLTGRRLAGVRVAWHEPAGVRGPLATHVWLLFEDGPPLQLHTPGDGRVALVEAEPYGSYEMGGGGRVVVEDAAPGFPLTAHLGEEIRAVGSLRAGRRGDVGLVVRFAGAAVGVANVADELLVLPWPSPRWREMGIAADM